jgi:SAM-dependent methyltransferase
MDRKQAEMEFHDRREMDRKSMSEGEWLKKYSNKRWYAIVENSDRFINNWIATNVPGKAVLDFGCGLGGMSLQLARSGAAKVYAIDISPESVRTTEEVLVKAGFGERLAAQVMDAEAMTFPDASMDVVVCSGVLHHMYVTKAFPEIARVLKPSGIVIAIEALGYNPAINLYRKLTPHLRTEWEVDHILTMRELREARKSFDGVKVRFFHLTAIGAALFQKTPLFKPVLAVTNALDWLLLRIPGINLMAWQMVFFLSNPKKKQQA